MEQETLNLSPNREYVDEQSLLEIDFTDGTGTAQIFLFLSMLTLSSIISPTRGPSQHIWRFSNCLKYIRVSCQKKKKKKIRFAEMYTCSKKFKVPIRFPSNIVFSISKVPLHQQQACPPMHLVPHHLHAPAVCRKYHMFSV